MESVGAEEKNRTLTGTLSKLIDDMNEKLNKFKQDYSKALNEIQELKKETEKIKTQMKDVKIIEWETRNKNIIIFGLKEFKYESKLETLNRVTNLFTEVLKINFKDRQIDNIYWIGKRKLTRPFLVKFNNTITKDHIKNKKRIFKKDDNWTLSKIRQPGSLEQQGYNHETCNISMESTYQAKSVLTHNMQEESNSRPRGNERPRTTREGNYDDHSKGNYYLRNRSKFLAHKPGNNSPYLK